MFETGASTSSATPAYINEMRKWKLKEHINENNSWEYLFCVIDKYKIYVKFILKDNLLKILKDIIIIILGYTIEYKFSE